MEEHIKTQIDQLITNHQERPGALLPLLHDIQEAIGYIPTDRISSIAQGLNLSRAEVHGVISYYQHFRTTPPGRNVIRLCRAEACQARGSEALAAYIEPIVEGRDLTLEPVYCLGLCANGPVDVTDISNLFDAGLIEGGAHYLRLGLTKAIPYLARQQRVSMGRIGVVDPRSLEDYLAHGGGQGMARARAMTPAAIVKEVTDSGLRGRGGAAFPTGIKWNTVLNTQADQKYIVCNADEGDSGTFADRLLMEGDPFSLFEGMAIAGLAVGATKGYIYLRSEYPHAAMVLKDALTEAGEWLDGFDIELRKAAGSY
jgi:NADH:ubiquinone oxidoreductase subunit E